MCWYNVPQRIYSYIAISYLLQINVLRANILFHEYTHLHSHLAWLYFSYFKLTSEKERWMLC